METCFGIISSAKRRQFRLDASIKVGVSFTAKSDMMSFRRLTPKNYGEQMTEPILLTSESPILSELNFKPYRSSVVRKVKPFLPAQNEPQSIDVQTPWGATLTAKHGDMLLSELDAPNDVWPVNGEIFSETYMMIERGYCVKSAVTMLVPMVDVTKGDEEQHVTIETMEGPQTVRAGDFYLARGVKGEIWSIPREKVASIMKPVE